MPTSWSCLARSSGGLPMPISLSVPRGSARRRSLASSPDSSFVLRREDTPNRVVRVDGSKAAITPISSLLSPRAGRASEPTPRSVVTQAVLSPVESSRRIFLIEEAGMMTEQAANALLKTLEEPTASVTFLLISESEEDFPRPWQADVGLSASGGFRKSN